MPQRTGNSAGANARGSGTALRAALIASAISVMALQPAHAQAPADPYSYARVTAYTYDSVGRVATETVEPNNLASCVLTSHAYDSWGNRNSTTQANCSGTIPTRQQIASRTSTTQFDASGISGYPSPLPFAGLYPVSATNALNQSGQAGYDARFGAKTWAKDANGLQTTWTLDDFGRVTRQTNPDGTSTISRYCYVTGRVTDLTSNSSGCDSGVPTDAPADAVSYVHSEPRDTQDAQMGPYTRVYSDRRGRELRAVTQSFDGANQPGGYSAARIVKDTVYSAVGTKIIETQPYFLHTGSSTTSGSNDRGATLTQYDALGRPVNIYTADPQGLAGSQSFGTFGSATASKASFTYNGQTTTQTNDKGQVRTEEKNAGGMLVRITDPAGGQLAHQHDAFGNLVATKDALQNTIQIKYSIRGFRLELNDPDAGLWKYDYDVLGQIVWQENAKQRAAGTVTTMVYDPLGRMTSRVEPEGTGTWSYDKYADNSSCATGIGRLCESSFTRAGTSDIRKTRVYYDSVGRPISDVATITNGPGMATAKSYSTTTGRLATKTYPTGVKVGYGYTTLGFAYQLQLLTQATVSPLPATAGGTPGAGTTLSAGTALWQAKIVNAWGKTEQQSFSNGVTGRATYQTQTGRTTALTAGPGSTNTVLNYGYTWDSLNNLTYRVDNIGDNVAGAVSETFEYIDGLSRLTKYTVAAPGVPGGSRAVTLQYNALGMLLNKSDVGVYTYGSSGAGAVRPHALLSMAPTGGGAATNYVYDANGNLTTANGGKYRTIAYTSFNLPDGQSGIGGAPNGSSGGTATYTWLYDENHQRTKETRTIAGGTMAGTRTTWYLHPDNAGNLGFEYEQNSPTTPTATNPNATSSRHYLSFGGSTIGILATSAALPNLTAGQTAPPTISSVTVVKMEYWHKDHLGSLVATTDHQGAVTARYAYDPFGKRRYTNGSYDPFGNIVVDWSGATNAGTDRGYTEHEHLDDVGIIHMNGRIFDPTLGRFLQVDPNVTILSNLQNYQRYAYCLNNPLTCTDPSGFDQWWLEPPVAENTQISVGLGVTAILGGFQGPLTQAGAILSPQNPQQLVNANGGSFQLGVVVDLTAWRVGVTTSTHYLVGDGAFVGIGPQIGGSYQGSTPLADGAGARYLTIEGAYGVGVPGGSAQLTKGEDGSLSAAKGWIGPQYGVGLYGAFGVRGSQNSTVWDFSFVKDWIVTGADAVQSAFSSSTGNSPSAPSTNALVTFGSSLVNIGTTSVNLTPNVTLAPGSSVSPDVSLAVGLIGNVPGVKKVEVTGDVVKITFEKPKPGGSCGDSKGCPVQQ